MRWFHIFSLTVTQGESWSKGNNWITDAVEKSGLGEWFDLRERCVTVGLGWSGRDCTANDDTTCSSQAARKKITNTMRPGGESVVGNDESTWLEAKLNRFTGLASTDHNQLDLDRLREGRRLELGHHHDHVRLHAGENERCS